MLCSLIISPERKTQCAERVSRIARLAVLCCLLSLIPTGIYAQENGKQGNRNKKDSSSSSVALTFPPTLPDDQSSLSDCSEEFLAPPRSLLSGVAVAQTPPTVDFLFYPGQDYEGEPWSNWGDGLAANGKYYSAIGDHLAIGAKGDGTHGTGTAFLFEYDPHSKTIRELVNTTRVLNLPAGHYTPGKIHSRIDMGSDGWLYFATHRGSKNATADKYHYKGDWIFRCDPRSGESEVVVQGPVPNHAIPCSSLDPDRLIFYGGTAAGMNSDHLGERFFAYDVKNKRLLYDGPDGPSRYMMIARSTGRLYYVPGNDEGPLMRFYAGEDSAPTEVPRSRMGIRAATQETADGFIYTVSLGQRSADANIWSFNTKTEETKKIGTAAVGTEAYVASVDADPSGRYLYYVPGAHGSGQRDGSPVVQFDVQTGKKKVIAFLEPFYSNKYGFTLKGSYSSALDPAGDKLYITWNVSRGSRAWDVCGLTVIHIPASERQP